MQFCQVANMIYQNANDNPTEVQKALFLWQKAMDKVRMCVYRITGYCFALLLPVSLC